MDEGLKLGCFHNQALEKLGSNPDSITHLVSDFHQAI